MSQTASALRISVWLSMKGNNNQMDKIKVRLCKRIGKECPNKLLFLPSTVFVHLKLFLTFKRLTKRSSTQKKDWTEILLWLYVCCCISNKAVMRQKKKLSESSHFFWTAVTFGSSTVLHPWEIFDAVIRSTAKALWEQICRGGDGQLKQVERIYSGTEGESSVKGLPKITCLVSGQWWYDAELRSQRDGWEGETLGAKAGPSQGGLSA